MGNCLLSDTNTLDMDDLSDLIPTYSSSSSSSSSSPHPSFGGGRGGTEWDVFNMRPGSRDPILSDSYSISLMFAILRWISSKCFLKTKEFLLNHHPPRGCVAGGSLAVGGGVGADADGLLASSSGVVSSRAGK